MTAPKKTSFFVEESQGRSFESFDLRFFENLLTKTRNFVNPLNPFPRKNPPNINQRIEIPPRVEIHQIQSFSSINTELTLFSLPVILSIHKK